MLHLILNKASQYVIATAFGLFAFGVFFLITQTQTEQREKTAQTEEQFESILKESLEATLKKETSSKIIYIDNFPVKTGHITSRYGMRKDPFTGKRTMHRGIDIAARIGTSIYPIGEGKVIFSGRKAGFGNMVEIQHSTTVVSRYSHLKKSLVIKGQIVKTTDTIAQVGNTGRSTGPHLHLEIAFNGKTANPHIYLSREVASSE
jgi:murein DD-endopeptidase MepM/ murein hydrolase activator NlpD